MNIAEPFIRRPRGTSLIALALVLAGAASFVGLPVSPLPRVDFPTVQVSASMPGASSETMASAVATPLERRLGRIAGLSELTSTSSLGSTTLTLQFDLERDMASAARDVQAAISASMGDLPANLPMRPSFRKVNPSDAPMVVLALTAPGLPMPTLYDAASTVLAQKISQVQGVGEVFVGGGQQSAVRVQADPAALASHGLSLEDVRRALGASNAHLPKGSLQGPRKAWALGATDQLFGAAEYRKLVVSMAGAQPLRLGDVAKVTDSVQDEKLAAWFDGERAILLILRREPGANTVATIARVLATLPGIEQALPDGIRVRLAINQSGTISASIRDVEVTLVLSVVLVVAVVFAFLRDLRASSIPSIAVPLSLLGTFAGMAAFGYSLDNLSLMALTISTGFVVDDAIVVTENVVQKIDRGATPMAAALAGVRDIGFTIVSITASLLAVFIPLLGMGGLIGRLFREFAVVLSLAVTISAVISLTITASMCAWWLRPRSIRGVERDSYATRPALSARLYAPALQWALGHRRSMLGLTLGLIATSVWQFVAIPKGLFPQQDTGMLIVSTEGPQQVSFAAMAARQKAVQDAIKQDRAVDHVVGFIGSAGGSSTNTGNAFVSLKPRSLRREPIDATIDRLRATLHGIGGIKAFLQARQDLRVGGRPTRTQYQYSLQDADFAELGEWAPRVLAALKTLPELRDVATNQQTNGLEAHLQLDRLSLARYGISASEFDNTLYDAFGQRQATTVYDQKNPSKVILEVLPSYRHGPQSLQQLWLHANGASGVQAAASGATASLGDVASDSDAGAAQEAGLVPLGQLATLSERQAPLSISHQGQFPAVTLSFNLAPNVALGDAVKAVRRLEAQLGLPPGLRADFQGTAQAFRATTSTMPWLIAAALVAVYMVLGMLYESLIHPITILSTIPSAGVGALWMLRLCHQDFGVLALIGIVLLIGIVKKNAIMIVDLALSLQRTQGCTAQAAIERACMERLRPILMTTAAALLGALPLAIGQGDGSELRRPLGIALVGGLVVSQLVTLFTTPVVYLALEKIRVGTTKAARKS